MPELKRKITVTITVDTDKLKKLYPNYGSNFNTPDECIDFIIASDFQSKDFMNTFGYKLKTKEKKRK
jgi:hypothetical protein